MLARVLKKINFAFVLSMVAAVAAIELFLRFSPPWLVMSVLFGLAAALVPVAIYLRMREARDRRRAP